VDSEFNSARTLAYRILASRRRTSFELEKRLEQNGISGEVSIKVVNYLAGYGYIDDRAFAHDWIEQRHPKRGFYRLKRELMVKGIAVEIINELLDELDQEAESAAAIKLAQKKISSLGGSCSFARLAGFLERRGFSYRSISIVHSTFFGQ